jgi:glycosyltransferase involved in cell wall biosynthesis
VKILFVNEKCGYFGGVELNVAQVAETLRARGHQCFLAYGSETDRDAGGYAGLFDGSFGCVDLAAPAGPAATPFGRIMAQVTPDVVYLHKVPDLQFYEPFFSRTRAVRMVHDHDLCCPRRHKYYTIGNGICRHRAGWRCWLDGAFLARSSAGLTWVSIPGRLREMRRNHRLDRVLVASRFMREELVQNGFSPEKVRVFPYAIRLKPCVLSDVPRERRVLYAGQLIYGKGVDLLLRALQMVKCEFCATIVGTGNAQAQLLALCHRLGLSDKVEFKGWVGHQGIEAYYSSARVLAVPSRWAEPFGFIGLEAMHHGRPVVGFDVGGISDWLEPDVTGLLVAEQDVPALARAVERLLTDDKLASALGRNAYARVRARFSFDQYIADMESHLRGEEPPARPA